MSPDVAPDPLFSVRPPEDVMRDDAARKAAGWLDTAGAAAYLGVSVSAVKRWRRLNAFAPAVLLGRIPRWQKRDLDRWCEARRERQRPVTLHGGYSRHQWTAVPKGAAR